MHKESRDVKFQMMFSPSELCAIDEYRWQNRIGSRAEAMRRLIEQALKTKTAEGEKPASTTPTAADTTETRGNNDA